jgi:hypothetical protein
LFDVDREIDIWNELLPRGEDCTEQNQSAGPEKDVLERSPGVAVPSEHRGVRIHERRIPLKGWHKYLRTSAPIFPIPASSRR